MEDKALSQDKSERDWSEFDVVDYDYIVVEEDFMTLVSLLSDGWKVVKTFQKRTPENRPVFVNSKECTQCGLKNEVAGAECASGYGSSHSFIGTTDVKDNFTGASEYHDVFILRTPKHQTRRHLEAQRHEATERCASLMIELDEAKACNKTIRDSLEGTRDSLANSENLRLKLEEGMTDLRNQLDSLKEKLFEQVAGGKK